MQDSKVLIIVDNIAHFTGEPYKNYKALQVGFDQATTDLERGDIIHHLGVQFDIDVPSALVLLSGKVAIHTCDATVSGFFSTLDVDAVVEANPEVTETVQKIQDTAKDAGDL